MSNQINWQARAEKAEARIIKVEKRWLAAEARAEKAEATNQKEARPMSKRDNAVVGLVSGHLRAEARLHSDVAIHDRLIAWAEGIEGVLARAEKAEAALAELEEIDEVCRAETKRADYWKAEAEKARAALKEQGQ